MVRRAGLRAAGLADVLWFALASVKRSHIGCPEVVDLMPWKLRRALGILAQLLVIGFFVLLGWVAPRSCRSCTARRW
jgi:TRAP-type C4-dicarboxylate transport system permease small subunit